MGILTKGETQFVFIDTPGLHKPKNVLGENMMKAVNDGMADVDAAVLVVDAAPHFTVDENNIPSAEQSFAKKPEAKWLADNCYRFGFILRYAEDKEDITKIIYEPWHFRYVGRRFATEMHEKNMCLEEYLKYLGKEP